MSSYFANYLPDMRNGGVVSAEHQHQHYGAAVQVAQTGPQGGGNVQGDPNGCDPSMRQGIPPHHYAAGPPAAGQPPQGMPYPSSPTSRFPPYDRMDIRNAGYYNQQQMDGGGGAYGRPDSPSMHMGGAAGQPNGHQTPVVYASCKLQAVTQNGVLGGGSPPLVDATGAQTMTAHHMGHHMQEQHPQHHAVNCIEQQPPHPHQQQQHMMYGGQPPTQPGMHQPPPHQQPPPLQQQPQPGQQPPNNTASALPSPLYPWMRSQFGEYSIQTSNFYFLVRNDT
nr:unnamed protein product [Callosobruchus analis]